MKSDYDYYKDFADWLKKRYMEIQSQVDAPALIGTKENKPAPTDTSANKDGGEG